MSFYNERAIKAVRKRHMCAACNKFIEAGESAISWAGMTDGDFGAAYFHPDCRVAEIEYNREVLGWMGGDDWWPLHEIESEDRPWLKAKHPAVYLRVCRTREQQAEAMRPEVRP